MTAASPPLARQLTDAVRHHGAAKRDAGLEFSLERALEDSAGRLEQLLAENGRPPEEQCIHDEDLVALAAALARLADDQRKVIEWKFLQGLSLDEIAERLDRSNTAVSGLLWRARKKLREILHEG